MMARITESGLVQRTDDLIVFMDESKGQEVTFPVGSVPILIEVLRYLGGGDV